MTGRREALTATRRKKAKRLLERRQFAEAHRLYAEICAIDPRDYDSWLQLAELSSGLGALNDAEAAYRQAAALRPHEAKPVRNLGLLYKTHGHFDDAGAWLWRYAQLLSDGIGEYKRLGTDMHQRGRLDLAVKIYRNLLQLTPEDTDTWNNLGVALHNRGELDAALAAFNQALTVGPPRPHLYCNLANVYVDQDEDEQALQCYRQALQLDPDAVTALGSLGGFYMRRMQLDEALAHFDKAIALDSGFAGAYMNRALIHLLQGDFSAGWREYDARFDSPEVVRRYGRREFTIPMWAGQPIPGKTLLVYAEQGFGDSIQFCRYLPLVRQRVDHVVFESRPELMRLLQTLPGDIEYVARRDDLAMPAVHFDYQIPLLSLPRVFATDLENIPSQIPYLHAEAALVEQWGGRMQGTGFKVGLVWAGSPGHKSDRDRSLNPAQLAPLLRCPGVDFYSLQMGAAARHIAAVPADARPMDLGRDITDFADSAAIIANLDLLISVDTAAVHLAGALGKPVWLLVYRPTDWRWLLDRDDSPWYPTLRLFRQGSDRDWAAVIARVAAALHQFAAPSVHDSC